MDSRAQFEEWYFRRYGKKDLTKVRDHAEFCDAWEVWQASRLACLVSLAAVRATTADLVLIEQRLNEMERVNLAIGSAGAKV